MTAPAPPELTVSFVRDALTVEEGKTADIEVRYRSGSLASPLSVTVFPVGQGASREDYELSATSFEIPAGQGVTGTAALALTALPDNQISEGQEMVLFRLAPPAGIRAQLGANLTVTIADGAGVACPGIRVQASPVAPLDGAPWLTTSLAISREPGAGRVQFDWEGPYLHDANCDDDDCREWWETRSPVLELNVVEWRIESSPRGTHHSMDIEWYEAKTAQLRFRSPAGACASDQAVSCAYTGCILTE